jgi:hypothetical protein
MLPALKLGSYKVRKISLLLFLEKYEGKDLTNPEDIQDLALENNRSLERNIYERK